VLLKPGDAVLYFPSTYNMYPFDMSLNNGKAPDVRRHEDFSLELPAIEEAIKRWKPNAIFVDSSDNPDGGFLTLKILKACSNCRCW
jgi:histidinol-phosphate/aromatic aminotransferase/cobyric acid decarboxylase-like protein